jgi:hypothetical protein
MPRTSNCLNQGGAEGDKTEARPGINHVNHDSQVEDTVFRGETLSDKTGAQAESTNPDNTNTNDNPVKTNRKQRRLAARLVRPLSKEIISTSRTVAIVNLGKAKTLKQKLQESKEKILSETRRILRKSRNIEIGRVLKQATFYSSISAESGLSDPLQDLSTVLHGA